MTTRLTIAFANRRAALGWLLLVSLLTFVLYLPTWFAVGSFLYHGTHPDYWTLATPGRIFPLSALLASTIVIAIRWTLARK